MKHDISYTLEPFLVFFNGILGQISEFSWIFLPFLVADFAFLTFTAKQPKLTLDVFFGASRIAHLPLPEATPPGRKSKNYTIGNETTRRIIVRTNHPKNRINLRENLTVVPNLSCKKNMSKTSKSHNRPRRDENLSGLSWFLKINSMPPPETNHWNPKSSLGTGRLKKILKGGLRGDLKELKMQEFAVPLSSQITGPQEPPSEQLAIKNGLSLLSKSWNWRRTISTSMIHKSKHHFWTMHWQVPLCPWDAKRLSPGLCCGFV